MNDDLWKLKFEARLSVQYHEHRRTFFYRLDFLYKLVALIGGSTAFFSAGQGIIDPFYGKIAALLIVFLSFCNVIVSFSTSYSHHSDLRTKFIALLDKIEASDGSVASLSELRKEKTAITSGEKPTLRVLSSIAYNETIDALGGTDIKKVEIGPLQRLFSDFFDFRKASLRQV